MTECNYTLYVHYLNSTTTTTKNCKMQSLNLIRSNILFRTFLQKLLIQKCESYGTN